MDIRRYSAWTLIIAILLLFLFAMLLPSSHRSAAASTSKYTFNFHAAQRKINLLAPAINSIPSKVSWQLDIPSCSNKSIPLILVMVPSALANRHRRNFIRETWGNVYYYPYTNLRVVFVLGATENSTQQQNIVREHQTHCDIVQNKFIDSYRNLTYKTISWLWWAHHRCPGVPYVAKVDDDVLVNPFHLHNFLSDELVRKPRAMQIYGRLKTTAKPWRDGKWNVSKADYPHEYYPSFVLGPAYIIGGNAIGPLLQHTKHVPMLWLEDVYLTGLVARKARIGHIGIDSSNRQTLYTNKVTWRLYKGKLIFVLDGNEEMWMSGWTFIIKYAP